MTPTDVATLAGKRVFLTGHTGFKGSWLAILLHRLGCDVHGYALPPRAAPSLYQLADISSVLAHQTLADIKDAARLNEALRASKPDLVLHLAAQAFVRRSYADPVDTWAVNVQGTVNLLEAVRALPSVQAVVVVTTDKCYENRDWEWGYRENDLLGGHDPYSASKAAAELAVQSYRRSFFEAGDTRVASARAGNVIGGGDWSEDRLVADAARAAASGATLDVRRPDATRPWQHVLDCLGGYLKLSAALLNRHTAAASAFNFGPNIEDNVTVAQVLARLQSHWPELDWSINESAIRTTPHEAGHLHLDSGRARQLLGWQPRWRLDDALARTADWYRTVQSNPTSARAMMAKQIEEYLG